MERELRAVYGAYEYLRDHELAANSTTSRILRGGDLAVPAARVGEELEELRGAVSGTHRHLGGRDDVVLEASQVLYWLIVMAVAARDRYADIRPHELLAASGRATRGEVTRQFWVAPVTDPSVCRQALRAGFAALARLCRQAGVDAVEVVRHDLDELRGKEYLATYWAGVDSPAVLPTEGALDEDSTGDRRSRRATSTGFGPDVD